MARLAAPALFTLATRAAAPRLAPALVRLDGPALALTFDDGPDPRDTPHLLDLLDRLGVRATFFLIGTRARRHPDLVRAVREAGHTVGQHSDTHADPWRVSRGALALELARATRTLEDQLGEPVRWTRPPYGHLTPRYARWAAAHRQRVALWDVMPGDFLPGQSSDGVHRLLTRYCRPGSVIVLHEGGRSSGVTPDALARWLPEALAAGLRFEAL